MASKELYYERVSAPRRIASTLFDSFCSLVLILILFFILFYSVNSTASIKYLAAQREDILLSSHLYYQEDNEANNYKDYVLSLDVDYDEKSSLLDESLSYFYSDYLKEEERYSSLKEEASYQGIKLFTSGERAEINDDYDEIYLNFYEDAFDTSLSILYEDEDYFIPTRTIFWIYVACFLSSYAFSFFIFYFIVPFVFLRKTKKTFGMLLTRIAILGVDGFIISNKKFVFRFIFFYFIEVILSLFTFLIPLLVSLGFLIMSKSRQTLHDYVFNTYAVSSIGVKLFANKAQYRLYLENSEK